MSKEDKSGKKDHMDESIVNTDDGQGTELHSEKSHSKKDKKHKTDSHEELVKQWQAKCDELNDKYLRIYSEFDNYRKRTQKERIELSKTASEEIILSLLPVMDDLERALTSTLKTADNMEVIPKEGLQLIYQKFKGLLVQKGLEVIPAIGEDFSVDFHDALTNIPAPSEDMKGKVVDEVEKGYKLNGKVIRYSKVVVGN
ncbi:MAG: nucleotide exchange factor GrpE [Bacteroidales bacterium]|nr:nucleotide exchange factor GrpE [Bacteroidales bacterium]